MIGKDFVYCDKRLSEYKFVMAKPDEDDFNGLTREVLKGEVTAKRKEAIHYGTKYSDVIKLNFFIVKDPCLCRNQKLSYNDTRAIQSWLTSTTVPTPLSVEFDDGVIIEYKGLFTEITPYYINGVNGFTLVFTCNSSFAYKSNELKIESVGSYGLASRKEEITCDTDENDFIYPIIFISGIKENGYYSITNNEDGNTMTLYLDKSYSEYIIDCKLKRILADDSPISLQEVGWNIQSITDYNNVNTGIFKAYWLRLLPSVNNLVFDGNAECVIKYQEPIKILGGCTYV